MNDLHIVVASGNAHKVEEIQDIFSDLGIPVLSIFDVFDTVVDVIEDGDTFEANALKKVEKLPVHEKRIYLSDDSGISVHALGNRPGIYSARYGGEGVSTDTQCRMILEELDGNTDRGAHYTCSIALKLPNGEMPVYTAEFHGRIGHDLIGENGFGYDPIFLPDGTDKTVAQLPLAEKQRMSHRYKALMMARERIASFS